MNRRGFALLAVLWVVAILGIVVGSSMRLARVGAGASTNRVTLTRAGWAREACLEILLARYAAEASVRLLDTVDLGRGTWCRAELEDAGSRLDLNHAVPEALRTVIGSDSLADALLDWRDADDDSRPHGAEAEWYLSVGRRPPRNGPLADVAELRLIRGFGDTVVGALTPLLTTRGTARLNLNSAPAPLLATLPGVGPEAIDVVSGRRLTGQRIQGIDQLAGLLSPPAREALLARYQELGPLAVVEPAGFTAVLEGGVEGAAPVARAVLMLVPAGSRLAVVRQEVE